MQYARTGSAPGVTAPGTAAATPFPGKTTLVDRIQPVPPTATPPLQTAAANPAAPADAAQHGDGPAKREGAGKPRNDAHAARDAARPPAAKTATAKPGAKLHEAMSPPAAALQALAGVAPSMLPQAFPIAAAALEEARGRAGDAVADHHDQPPRAPAVAAAAPARATPEPPRRDPHRPAPIAHAPTAGEHPAAPAAPDRVSAGPRPRVALTGASDPLVADARHHATHDALATHRRRADTAAQRDFAIDRIPVPAAALDRRAPPALGGAIPAPSLPSATARPASSSQTTGDHRTPGSSSAASRAPAPGNRTPGSSSGDPRTPGSSSGDSRAPNSASRAPAPGNRTQGSSSSGDHRAPDSASRAPAPGHRTPGSSSGDPRAPDSANRAPDSAAGGDRAIEAMVAPRLAEKITAAAAGVRAVAARSESHAAAFDARRQAAAQREAAEQAQLRTTAAHRTEGVRDQWQQANTRLHQEHGARIAHKHDQMKRTVQDSVLHTETQADRHLGDAEARGSQELAAARGRADAIRSQASAQVSDRPAYDPGGGGGGELDAAAVLAEAQRLVDEMLTAARQHNTARLDELRRQVSDLLTAHATELQTFIETTLAEFPLIGQFYQQQIDELMALVQSDSAMITLARGDHDRAMVDALTEKLTHDLSLMKRYFGEVETIASYGGDIDKLRAAFGISFNGDKWGQKNYEEIALLAAISTEHAFRRSATDGQMDGTGFGQGFQAVFGQMNMDYNSQQAYRYDVKQAPDGSWYTYSVNSAGVEVVAATYATQDEANQNRSPYGAETKGPHRVEFYDLAFRYGDRDPNNLLFNVIHEFGHAFNQNSHGRGYNTLDAEVITGMVNGASTNIAGRGVPRNTTEAYGMRGYPYQENRAGTTGEEFADMFLNWVENSFADNDAGRARFQWMNQHMWGDTGQRGVDGQQRWGWADTAVDRNSGSSEWVDPNTRGGRYTRRPGDTLQGIAERFHVDASAIQTANIMGNSTDVSAFPVLIIPGVSQADIDRAASGG